MLTKAWQLLPMSKSGMNVSLFDVGVVLDITKFVPDLGANCFWSLVGSFRKGKDTQFRYR